MERTQNLSPVYGIRAIRSRTRSGARRARVGHQPREMKMRRKVLSLGAALIAATLLAGCSAIDALGTGTGRVAGTYELRSVNGASLPALYYQEPGYRLEVLNANFTIETDGTYSEALILRETVNGSTSTTSQSTYGFYDYLDGELTFDEASGRRYYGFVDGNTLTVEDEGVRMVYRRF